MVFATRFSYLKALGEGEKCSLSGRWTRIRATTILWPQSGCLDRLRRRLPTGRALGLEELLESMCSLLLELFFHVFFMPFGWFLHAFWMVFRCF